MDNFIKKVIYPAVLFFLIFAAYVIYNDSFGEQARLRELEQLYQQSIDVNPEPYRK